MRCRNKNCKTKLDRENTFKISGYADSDLETNDFSKIGSPVKILVCRDCAKMYFGKFHNEDDPFGSMKLINEMEFKDEFLMDIFGRLK
jgi:hypothetical protein